VTVGESTAARSSAGALLPTADPRVDDRDHSAAGLPAGTLDTPRRTRPTIVERLTRPGWPLAAILVPMPLWWVLGLTEWIVPVMAVPMVLHLLRVRNTLAPKGFGWWLAFLLWVVAGGFLLQVHAFGAVADRSSTRFITFDYRLGWYLAITVVLLYVVNTRRELSTTRVTRILAAMFVTVTFGGLLGVVAPYFQFTSVAEFLLPPSLTKFELISDMVHPRAAQIQGVLGYVAPRPSAPFSYTNTWGLVFAVTLPFFLLAWTGKSAGWRRWAAGPILLLSAIPAIYSINRGMWLAVIVMALFVAVKGAFTGRPKPLIGVVAAAAAVALLLAVTPLGTIVSARFSNEGSKQLRQDLSALAVQSVAVTSPIVGLGSTRNVQGNFASISGGATANCPACSPPALGTQGQLWLVIFANGLVGFALFAFFYVLVFLRHLRLRSPVVTVSSAALVGWVVTLPFYNSLGIGMLIVMVAVALMFRESADQAGAKARQAGGSLVPLGHYTSALRSGVPVLLAFALVGAVVGWGWHQQRPDPYSAQATLLLPQPPRSPSGPPPQITLDNDAQLANDSTVQEAVAAASGRSTSEVAKDLTVTATANSRILHLHFAAPTAQAARSGVDAAADAFVRLRGDRLAADRAREVAKLDALAKTATAGVNRLNRQIKAASPDGPETDDPQTAVARNHRNKLVFQASTATAQSAELSGIDVIGGQRTEPTKVVVSSDRLRVDVVSGLTAGLGLGGLLVILWGAAGPRLRRVHDVRTSTGLRVLDRIPAGRSATGSVATQLADQPTTFVAVSQHDAVACAMVDDLLEHATHSRESAGDAGVAKSSGATSVVIVASDRARVDQVHSCHTWLTRQGLHVAGLLIATGRGHAAGRRSR
jgi:hypothetical protein